MTRRRRCSEDGHEFLSPEQTQDFFAWRNALCEMPDAQLSAFCEALFNGISPEGMSVANLAMLVCQYEQDDRAAAMQLAREATHA